MALRCAAVTSDLKFAISEWNKATAEVCDKYDPKVSSVIAFIVGGFPSALRSTQMCPKMSLRGQ